VPLIGLIVFRYTRFDSQRQRDELVAFLKSLPEVTPSSEVG
jgi:hypothetical protein